MTEWIEGDKMDRTWRDHFRVNFFSEVEKETITVGSDRHPASFSDALFQQSMQVYSHSAAGWGHSQSSELSL